VSRRSAAARKQQAEQPSPKPRDATVAGLRRKLLNLGYGYHGASTTKKAMRGWVTGQGGPDADITFNVEKLRERSRDLCMSEGIAIGALRTIRTNEIGSGLRLNAQIDAPFLGLTPEEAQAWEDNVERQFTAWARSRECDAGRRCTFGELQALARLSQLMSGDVFALLPAIPRAGERFDLKVQLVEADRVCDPMVRDPKKDILGGVEVGDYGEPVAFYFAERHPGDMLTPGLRLVQAQKWTRVPAFGEETGRPLVLHLMEMERPGQRRGVPLLAPVIEKLKQLSRYAEAEIAAAVVSALFTLAITTENPQNPLGQVPDDANSVKDPDDKGDPIELGNGNIIGLAPGEKAEAIGVTRPNPVFGDFFRAVCQQIGAGLGVPYEILLKQFDASYSASRAALLEFWKAVNVGRAWMITGFCQPIYEQWIEEAVLRGYIDAPGFLDDPLKRAAWCGAEWIGPTQGQLNPTLEVEAAKLRIEAGLSSRTREAQELCGVDFWANTSLRGREEQARSDAGLVGAKALNLTPTDNAALATVNEGRAAAGLPPEDGGDDETVLERTTSIQRSAGVNPNQPPQQGGAA